MWGIHCRPYKPFYNVKLLTIIIDNHSTGELVTARECVERHTILWPWACDCIPKPRLHDTAGCQTGFTTGLTIVLNEQRVYSWLSIRLSNGFDNWLNVSIHDRVTTGCQSGLTTGLTTGSIVYTNVEQVVKPDWQPVSQQQVVSCKEPEIEIGFYRCANSGFGFG